MHRTASATPLDAVMVASRGPVTDVWLRRNIEQVDVELPEGGSQLLWVADEVMGTLPGRVTEQAVAARFALTWDALEEGAMTDRELIGHRADELDGALLEVTEMLSDTTGDIDDATGAILELSEMVAELYDMVGGE